ncbi:MAG: hypothetical protein QFX32_06090 [Methanolinea sp.]|nr:hypothetical protein [Methanolinea sp.]
MWRENGDGTMSPRRICPLMSDSRGIVLCQGKNCAAAYSVRARDGEAWYCAILEDEPRRASPVLRDGDGPWQPGR